MFLEKSRHGDLFLLHIAGKNGKDHGSVLYVAETNCLRKRRSFCEYSRRSLTRYFNWQILSIPMPKAKPVYLLGSILKFCNTFGCTIPLPRISTHPVCLQTLHPVPPQIRQLISISA